MLLGREHGPLAFQLIIQPTVAAILAIPRGCETHKLGARPMAGPSSLIRVTSSNGCAQAGKTWAPTSHITAERLRRRREFPVADANNVRVIYFCKGSRAGMLTGLQARCK